MLKRFLRPRYLLGFTGLAVLSAILIPPLTHRRLPNPLPLPAGYLKGVYHLHSVYSDGSGDIGEIAAAGKKAGADFVILTDHGRPNFRCLSSSGRVNGVWISGGSELSLYSGHLACVGFRDPGYLFPPEPQEAIDEMNEQGAASFIAHPLDKKIPWTDWRVKDFTGIEIMSCYASARHVPFWRLLIFPLQYAVNGDYALTRALHYPSGELEKWREINQKGRYYGIYALDAHARLPLTSSWELKYPSYRSMFRIFMIYLIPETAAVPADDGLNAHIARSLLRGSFFNVIESIASANGFKAFFVGAGGQRTEVGGQTPEISGTVKAELPFQFKTLVLLKKDGAEYLRAETGGPGEVSFPVTGPGVYHLEVYASESRFAGLPWILANPFFVGSSPESAHDGANPSADQEAATVADEQTVKTGPFGMEKNDGSGGELTVSDGGGETMMLRFKLGKDGKAGENFWVALAARGEMDLTGVKGVAFSARADRPRRFWLEARTGPPSLENWHQRSFRANVAPREIRIPLHALYYTFASGQKEAEPLLNRDQGNLDARRVSSVFISINNAIAPEGAEGFLEIRRFRFYR